MFVNDPSGLKIERFHGYSQVQPKRSPPPKDMPPMGYDSGSRVTGDTRLEPGIPMKPEHRKFFGYGKNNY